MKFSIIFIEQKCYVLDFKNCKIKQSVKNFQLMQSYSNNPDKSINDEICLQFGRTGENSYILDFKFPFSPFQALSVALSSVDNKIACE
jgi:tubby-related protein 1